MWNKLLCVDGDDETKIILIIRVESREHGYSLLALSGWQWDHTRRSNRGVEINANTPAMAIVEMLDGSSAIRYT